MAESGKSFVPIAWIGSADVIELRDATLRAGMIAARAAISELFETSHHEISRRELGTAGEAKPLHSYHHC